MDQRDQQLEQFLDQLHQLFRFMKRSQWSEQGTNDITRTQWFILRILWRHERCTIGELAERVEVRPSTMSQMIDRLELAGLVCREPDKNDARTRIVRLTEAGQETMRKLKHVRVELFAEPFNQLDADERKTLVELITKLANHLPNKCE